MKALVVYDSMYGNTEKIAKTIGGAIGSDATVIKVGELNPSILQDLDLLIVGSPTQGARPTPVVQEFIDKMDASSLKDVNVASFDTRFSVKAGNVGIRIVAVLAGGFGYAAGRIADALKSKGAHLVKPPEGFIVNGAKGPLKDGELERAADWAKGIVEGGVIE